MGVKINKKLINCMSVYKILQNKSISFQRGRFSVIWRTSVWLMTVYGFPTKLRVMPDAFGTRSPRNKRTKNQASFFTSLFLPPFYFLSYSVRDTSTRARASPSFIPRRDFLCQGAREKFSLRGPAVIFSSFFFSLFP